MSIASSTRSRKDRNISEYTPKIDFGEQKENVKKTNNEVKCYFQYDPEYQYNNPDNVEDFQDAYTLFTRETIKYIQSIWITLRSAARQNQDNTETYEQLFVNAINRFSINIRHHKEFLKQYVQEAIGNCMAKPICDTLLSEMLTQTEEATNLYFKELKKYIITTEENRMMDVNSALKNMYEKELIRHDSVTVQIVSDYFYAMSKSIQNDPEYKFELESAKTGKSVVIEDYANDRKNTIERINDYLFNHNSMLNFSILSLLVRFKSISAKERKEEEIEEERRNKNKKINDIEEIEEANKKANERRQKFSANRKEIFDEIIKLLKPRNIKLAELVYAFKTETKSKEKSKLKSHSSESDSEIDAEEEEETDEEGDKPEAIFMKQEIQLFFKLCLDSALGIYTASNEAGEEALVSEVGSIISDLMELLGELAPLTEIARAYEASVSCRDHAARSDLMAMLQGAFDTRFDELSAALKDEAIEIHESIPEAIYYNRISNPTEYSEIPVANAYECNGIVFEANEYTNFLEDFKREVDGNRQEINNIISKVIPALIIGARAYVNSLADGFINKKNEDEEEEEEEEEDEHEDVNPFMDFMEYFVEISRRHLKELKPDEDDSKSRLSKSTTRTKTTTKDDYDAKSRYTIMTAGIQKKSIKNEDEDVFNDDIEDWGENEEEKALRESNKKKLDSERKLELKEIRDSTKQPYEYAVNHAYSDTISSILTILRAKLSLSIRCVKPVKEITAINAMIKDLTPKNGAMLVRLRKEAAASLDIELVKSYDERIAANEKDNKEEIITCFEEAVSASTQSMIDAALARIEDECDLRDEQITKEECELANKFDEAKKLHKPEIERLEKKYFLRRSKAQKHIPAALEDIRKQSQKLVEQGDYDGALRKKQEFEAAVAKAQEEGVRRIDKELDKKREELINRQAETDEWLVREYEKAVAAIHKEFREKRTKIKQTLAASLRSLVQQQTVVAERLSGEDRRGSPEKKNTKRTTGDRLEAAMMAVLKENELEGIMTRQKV